ncbi:ribulose-phosphate 3-epimerase [Rhizobium leguminosarum]|uniref:ribulose-phosphate 3-epimerase n=1 Tax=Rhizobium leguminosarum TaxID=384 RepID=UPI001C962964|nr:ribulose-phosphate 3-epimerase [Rhizobium leguminosarum]MBY5406445.1 ribulose-phosphate 3-epimerase [Rhizobium leguminosarum]
MKPDTNWLGALPTDRLLAEMSLWSADLGSLTAEIRRVDALTDIYHIDVADGHFSPALLFFPDLVAVSRKTSAKPLHVHLMATDDILLDQIKQFAEAGADLISVHAENGNISEALDLIDQLGLVSGIVLQLQTAVKDVEPHLGRISMLTLLGTRIGVKGQDLDEQACPRLQEAKAMIAARSSTNRIVLAADGGIREHTVPSLRRAGAETVVMGSLAFNAEDFDKRMAWIHAQPREA